jgi:hypothetical protein
MPLPTHARSRLRCAATSLIRCATQWKTGCISSIEGQCSHSSHSSRPPLQPGRMELSSREPARQFSRSRAALALLTPARIPCRNSWPKRCAQCSVRSDVKALVHAHSLLAATRSMRPTCAHVQPPRQSPSQVSEAMLKEARNLSLPGTVHISPPSVVGVSSVGTAADGTILWYNEQSRDATSLRQS